jgi:hypothetical protein
MDCSRRLDLHLGCVRRSEPAVVAGPGVPARVRHEGIDRRSGSVCSQAADQRVLALHQSKCGELLGGWKLDRRSTIRRRSRTSSGLRPAAAPNRFKIEGVFSRFESLKRALVHMQIQLHLMRSVAPSTASTRYSDSAAATSAITNVTPRLSAIESSSPAFRVCAAARHRAQPHSRAVGVFGVRPSFPNHQRKAAPPGTAAARARAHPSRAATDAGSPDMRVTALRNLRGWKTSPAPTCPVRSRPGARSPGSPNRRRPGLHAPAPTGRCRKPP